uniref:Uncharacterized protein n=1 Tax=Glossina brevipalpis TaxID=37001 RepID=A0A1A9WMJ4_9MUSC
MFGGENEDVGRQKEGRGKREDGRGKTEEGRGKNHTEIDFSYLEKKFHKTNRNRSSAFLNLLRIF